MRSRHLIRREIRAIVGERFAAVRHSLGMSQQMVAECMSLGYGWTQKTVSNIESGQRTLTLDEVFTLCELLDVAPVRFIPERPEVMSPVV